MRFDIQQKQFESLVKDAAVSAGKQLPMYRNVRILHTGNSLRLTCFNGDQTLQVDAYNEGCAGEVTVDLKSLQDALKTFEKTDHLTVNFYGDQLTLVAGQVVTVAAAEPMDQYFTVGTTSARLPVEQVKTITERLGFAAASYSSDLLGGVLIHDDGSKLRACATDGSRMVSMEDHSQTAANSLKIILPIAASNMVKKLLSTRKPQDVKFEVLNENKLNIKFDGVTLETRLIQGEYPRYAELFPHEMTAHLVCKLKPLTKMVKAAKKCADERTNLVRVHANGAFEVTSHTPDVAKYAGSLPYDLRGNISDASFAINGNYFIEALESAVGDVINIGFNGSLKPLVFTDADGRIKQLIMPVQAK